jgi:hypothetical protein
MHSVHQHVKETFGKAFARIRMRVYEQQKEKDGIHVGAGPAHLARRTPVTRMATSPEK